MIKVSELKAGDVIKVEEEGVVREGIVVNTSREENQALVDNGVQEFWYSPDHMHPILVDDQQLANLGFEKENTTDGAVKYKKGVFRLLIAKPGDFSHVDIWYREDRRHFNHPLAVHELQNLHADMAKIPLERPVH